MSCITDEIAAVHKPRDPVAHRSSWRDFLVLILVVAVPAVVVALSGHFATKDPTDEEITARFLSHEADFQRLVLMLNSDGSRLPVAQEPFDLGHLVAGGASGGAYRALLAKIGATDFSYFPRSGEVSLPISQSKNRFTDTKKSYLFSSHQQPQPMLPDPSHAWRGPGIYSVNGEHRIKGQWFIRNEGTVVVAVAPY